jgi:hypothetical protein
MAIMMADLHEALIEAGASEGAAKRAATEAAAQDNRLAAIEINTGNLDKRLSVVETKVTSLVTSAAVVVALLTVAEGMLATLVFKAFR